MEVLSKQVTPFSPRPFPSKLPSPPGQRACLSPPPGPAACGPDHTTPALVPFWPVWGSVNPFSQKASGRESSWFTGLSGNEHEVLLLGREAFAYMKFDALMRAPPAQRPCLEVTAFVGTGDREKRAPRGAGATSVHQHSRGTEGSVSAPPSCSPPVSPTSPGKEGGRGF